MKKVLVGFVILMAIAAGGCTHLSRLYGQERSLTGSWTMSVEHGGQMSLHMVLAQNGRDITGTLSHPHGGEFHVKGEFADGILTFSGSSDGADPIRLSVTGSMKSDGTLAGNLSSSMGDMTWTAVRDSSNK